MSDQFGRSLINGDIAIGIRSPIRVLDPAPKRVVGLVTAWLIVAVHAVKIATASPIRALRYE